MTNSANLVSRLESMHTDPISCGLERRWYVNPDGPEAAQLIREQSSLIAQRDAEIERLKEAIAFKEGEREVIHTLRVELGHRMEWTGKKWRNKPVANLLAERDLALKVITDLEIRLHRARTALSKEPNNG